MGLGGGSPSPRFGGGGGGPLLPGSGGPLVPGSVGWCLPYGGNPPPPPVTQEDCLVAINLKAMSKVKIIVVFKLMNVETGREDRGIFFCEGVTRSREMNVAHRARCTV